MWTTLDNIKTTLAGIPGVTTCKIGIESAISPDDYPLIRIVPTRAQHGAALPHKQLDVLIYFGVPNSEADAGSLEGVYQALCTLEDAIILAMESHQPFTAVWQETITDEDRLEAYKLFASRFTVVA